MSPAWLTRPVVVDDDDVGWEGTLVGGACDSDEDCDGECARGDEFPDGTAYQTDITGQADDLSPPAC